MLFRYDNTDPEILDEYGQWLDMAYDFCTMVHTRYGYYTAFPYSGGYYEQPYRTMRIFNCMLAVFREILSEKAKQT